MQSLRFALSCSAAELASRPELAPALFARPSQLLACVLILVGLKFTAVNVILVDLNKRVPLFRQIFLREDGRHRADRHTGAAINALCGIDIQLRHFVKRRAAIVISPAFRRMDAIHRAHVHTGGIFCTDAGFSDNVCYRSPPLRDLRLQISTLSLCKPYVGFPLVSSSEHRDHR